jgi:hypothetical protein
MGLNTGQIYDSGLFRAVKSKKKFLSSTNGYHQRCWFPFHKLIRHLSFISQFQIIQAEVHNVSAERKPVVINNTENTKPRAGTPTDGFNAEEYNVQPTIAVDGFIRHD